MVAAKGQAGFTLVELLVAVLIIGLLAAIALPTFLSQQTKAHDASAIENLASARTAMETYATDNDGEYSGASLSDLDAAEETLDTANLTINSAGVHSYEMTANSVSGNVFTIDQASNGTITRTCTASGKGKCSNDGTW